MSSNPRAISVVAILALAALTAWRLHTGRYSNAGSSAGRVRLAWFAWVMAIVIAALTDLSGGLGAAFAFAVIGLTVFQSIGAGAITPPAGGGSSGSSSGGLAGTGSGIVQGGAGTLIYPPGIAA